MSLAEYERDFQEHDHKGYLWFDNLAGDITALYLIILSGLIAYLFIFPLNLVLFFLLVVSSLWYINFLRWA